MNEIPLVTNFERTHKFKRGDRVGVDDVVLDSNEQLSNPCYGKVIGNMWDEEYGKWLVVIDVMNSEWTLHIIEKYVYHVD